MADRNIVIKCIIVVWTVLTYFITFSWLGRARTNDTERCTRVLLHHFFNTYEDCTRLNYIACIVMLASRIVWIMSRLASTIKLYSCKALRISLVSRASLFGRTQKPWKKPWEQGSLRLTSFPGLLFGPNQETKRKALGTRLILKVLYEYSLVLQANPIVFFCQYHWRRILITIFLHQRLKLQRTSLTYDYY